MIKPVSLPESSHATGSRRIHQITLDEGRTVEQKKRFYKTIAERREDAFINLAEVKQENGSCGNGIAKYAIRCPI